jgi:hypothetical protein
MRASFPTEFDAVLLGKSRDAGSFKTTDGDEISYGDAYDLSFESSDGLVQTCRVSVKQLHEAADFDVVKQSKLTAVHVRGDVNVGERSSFRPTEVRLKAPAAKTA